MGLIFKLAILASLIKLLIRTGSPTLCTVLYMFLALVVNLLVMNSVTAVVIATLIALPLSFFYFWLLEKLDGNGVIWWIWCILGMLIGLV